MYLSKRVSLCEYYTKELYIAIKWPKFEYKLWHVLCNVLYNILAVIKSLDNDDKYHLMWMSD